MDEEHIGRTLPGSTTSIGRVSPYIDGLEVNETADFPSFDVRVPARMALPLMYPGLPDLGTGSGCAVYIFVRRDLLCSNIG